MPDTNEERNVEDVLSSVRRLVSGELSGAQRRRSTPQALVLTPRQRISEARAPLVAQSLEDRIAELEAQLAGRQDEWEPDGSEDPETHRPSEPIILPAAQAGDDDAGPDAEQVAEPPRTLRRLSRIELVDPVTDDTEALDEIAEADDGPSEAEFDKELAETVARSVNAVISEITEVGNDAALVPEEPTAPPTPEEPTATPTPEEPPAATAPDELAADLGQGLDTAQGLNDDLDEAAAAAPVAPVPASETPARPPVPADRLEADLRDLVAQLIREELQGELGARITRNVRKLVRREIQRALAARDLS